MKVLVTGGAGYIGSVVTRALLSVGHEVRVLDTLLYGGHGVSGLLSEDRFHFMKGDLRSAPLVREALLGIEAVVHLAAIVGDPACSRQPHLAREVNHDASQQLFELSRQQGVQRFIFASTCSNYGKMADGTHYLTEASELRPVSLYAETKVAVERALLGAAAIAGAPQVTILRFATIFGISPRMRFDLTVNEFTMALLVKRKVTIYGEQCWRPYLHVRDAARAVALVLAAPAAAVAGRPFNIGDTSQNYTKAQLLELICSQLPQSVEIDRVQKAEDPRDYRVSFERVEREIGFRITRTVDAGVRELIQAGSHGMFDDFESVRYRN